MANEFVARNGLIAQDNSNITGSLKVTGKVSIGTDYAGFPLNVAGTAYIIGGSVWVNDGYGLVNANSTNTGIYPDSTHNITIKNNNSSNVYIKSDGNVGIGTTAPTSKLQVRVPESAGSATGFTIVGNTNSKVVALGANATYAFIQSHGSVPLYINELGNNVIINPATGNVAIGKTSPLVKLDVSGSVAVSSTDGLRIGAVGDNSAYDNVKLFYSGFNAGAPRIYLTPRTTPGSGIVPTYFHLLNTNGSSTTSNNTMGLLVDGSVGIGTTNPTSRLHISSSTGGAFEIDGVNGSIIMYVTSSGNVGIGTTSPVSKLHIERSISTVTTASLDNNTAVGLTVSYPDTALLGGEGIAIALGMTGRGRSFIANIHTSTSKDASDIAFYNESGAIISEKVRINSLGNVGIGTSTPGAKLDVILPANTLSHIFRSTAAENLLSISTFPTTNRMQLLVGDYNGTSAPNIGAISDSDTGIQWTGANILKFVNGGSENVTINAVGNVGIGTTSPTNRLHVSKTDGSNELIAIRVQNNLGYSEFGIQSNYARILANGVLLYAGTNGAQFYYYGGNVVMSLNLANVGIGTSNPTDKLDVFSSSNNQRLIRISHPTSPTSASAFIGFNSDGVTDNMIATIGVQYSNLYYNVLNIDRSTRNVGIGTTTPGTTLDVIGNVRAQSFTGSFSGSITSPGSNTQVIYNSSGVLAGSNNFVFDGTNVGIGTTSPSQKLTVYGGNANGQIRVGFADNANWEFGRDNGVTGDFILKNNIGANTFERLRITQASGNVGIGTAAPTGALQVHGVLSVSNNSVIGQGSIYGTSGAASYATLKLYDSSTGDTILNNQGYNIQLQTAGSTKLYIKNDGNVGIGTTAPAEKFHIAGGMRIYVNGSDSQNIGIYQANSSNTEAFLWQQSSTGASLNLWAYSATTAASWNNRVTFTAVGNVGIGTTSPTAKLQVSGSSNTVNVKGSGSALFSVDGTAGRLFQVDDSLSGSLFSVNTAAGLPVIEAFSDNTVRIGQFGQRALFVSQSRVGIGLENPTVNLHVSGTTGGVFEVDGINGSNGLYVSSSGAVGIGTTGGSAILHSRGLGGIVNIVESTNTVSYTQYYNTSTGTNSTNDGLTVGINGLDSYIFNREAGNLILGTSGTERMRITTAGNVGIGTTVPAGIFEVFQQGTGRTRGDLLVDADNKYVIVGRLSSTTSDVSSFKVRDRLNRTYFDVNTASKYISFNPETGDITMQIASGYGFKVNTNQFVVNATNGNVGIGTTTPGATLDVVGNVRAQSFTGSFSGSTTAPGSNTNVVYNSSGVLAGSNNFVFDGTNVGIGTTAPAYRLQVTGSTHLQYLQIQNGGYPGSLPTTPEIYSPASATLAISAGGSERLRISSTGNVGIGTTTPGSKLTVIGDIATSTRVAADTINGYTGGSTPLTIQTGGAQNIIFGTNATERMRLDTNGNLGIGASLPIAKLHVGVNLSDYAGQTFTNTGAIITSIGVDHTATRTNALSLMRDGTSAVVYAGLAAFDLSRWSSDSTNARTQLDIRLADTTTAVLTDVLSLRSDGNVGIGVTSSLARLHVSGTTGGVFEVDGVNAINALYVSSSGNVGVGTTTIASGARLHVGGYATTPNNLGWCGLTTAGALVQLLALDSNNRTQIGTTTSATVMTLTGTSVGIGTVSPAARLDVSGSAIIRGEGANLDIRSTTTTATINIYGLDTSTNFLGHGILSDNITRWRTGMISGRKYVIQPADGAGNFTTTAAIAILSGSGNVGIGSVTPAYKLDVNGTLGVTGTNARTATIQTNTDNHLVLTTTNSAGDVYSTYENSADANNAWAIGRGNDGVFRINYSTGATYTSGTTTNRLSIDTTGAATFNSSVTAVSFVETSTKEKKDNIQSYSTDINKFKQLEPVSYTWKDTGKSDVGLIAEEVDQLFPEFVSKTEEGEVTGINYGKLTTILINIVKQQQERIEKLEQQINK